MQLTEKRAALRVTSPICGKSEKLKNHLRKCLLVPSEIRAEALSPTDKDKENAPPSASNLAGPSNNQTRPSKKIQNGSSAVTFTSAAKRQRTFSEDLCKLFVPCGISWNALSNPEIMGKWIPDVALQDRRIISGRDSGRSQRRPDFPISTFFSFGVQVGAQCFILILFSFVVCCRCLYRSVLFLTHSESLMHLPPPFLSEFLLITSCHFTAKG